MPSKTLCFLAASTLATQLTGAALALVPSQGRPQPRPRTKTAPARPKASVAYGAKADSLGGIPGHRFGEPRSNFPELETRGFNNLDDYVSYSLRDNQPEAAGWFGKHADQVHVTYWFRHDQFAGFTATQHSWDNQPLLAGEVLYLFGPGKRVSDAFGQATTRWEGKQVLVEYVSGHNEGVLTISSQPVLAQVAAAKKLFELAIGNQQYLRMRRIFAQVSQAFARVSSRSYSFDKRRLALNQARVRSTNQRFL